MAGTLLFRRSTVAGIFLLVALPRWGQPPAPKAEVRAGGTTQELFRRAEEHYFNKKYHTSAELFRRVVAEQPEHLQAHTYLGDIYLMDREPDRALTHIRIAIELSPEPAREYFRLGQALYLKKDASGALAAYARAYAADPKLHEVHFQTGMVHLYLRRDAKATVRDWTQFRKLVPADAQGPDIDRAIRLLSDPQFKFPGTSADPCLPGPSESRVPDRAPPSTKTKEDNKSKDIIPVDEL